MHLLASFAFAAAFIGCNKSDNAPTQPSERKWTVSGKTYLVGSLDPVAGVIVKCAGLSSTSGADGSYQIREVPEGTQTITAEKPDCDSYSRSIEVKSDITFYVYLGFKSTNLWGFVTNAVDGPIKEARVTMHGFVDYTDISGLYHFTNIPQGTGTLFISHPNYISYDTALSLNASDKQFDIALKRDSIIQITTMSTTYVDESLPKQVFGLPVRLYLRGNGYDSLGHYYSGIRRYIYIKFIFPEIFRYPSVSIVEASLELCTDGPYPSTEFQTLSVMSSWTYYITYNSQPAIGSLLSSGFVGDSSSGKYWTVVGTDGFNQLVSIYRATGQFYGVMIRGGGFYPTGFYTGITRPNMPKITFKARY